MARNSRTVQRRKRPLSQLFFGIVAIGLVALLLAQTSPVIASKLNPFRSVVGDTMAESTQTGFWARITGQAARESRIRQLENEVRELSEWKIAAITMAERLEAYEDILHLQGEPTPEGVTARIIAESDGPFAQTYLANAGRLQGVVADSIALNEGGLVGRVIRRGEQSTRILLVSDFNSRVPIMGERTGLRAVMQGGRDGMGTLSTLPERGDFIEGERILTTSEAGVFPRGLLVGIVKRDGDAWRVDLAMNNARGGYVRLIPSPKISPPEADTPETTAETLEG